jgi:putative peptidoglycan lipid II flippase
MTELSRAAVDHDMPQLKRTLSATLRLVFLLTVPAAVWLAVMARPVIAVLYEHGHFHAIDTQQTADALVMYCIGLPAFAAVGVLTRTFYALGETRVPVQASFVSVGLNLALNLLFIGPWRFFQGLEHRVLLLSTSATALINLFHLGLYLRKRVGMLEGRRMLGTLVRVGLGSAAFGLVCALGLRALGERWHQGFVRESATVAAGLVVALVIGTIAMRLMRVEELGTVGSLLVSIRRRLFGR